MKLKEAIKELTDILTFVKPGDPPNEHDAMKLGIEALKRTMSNRVSVHPVIDQLLPGETED